MKTKDIFLASREGNLEIIKQALGNGFDPNQEDEDGFTPLHYAAMGSNSLDEETILDVLKLLVESGCPLETIAGGRTALYFLAEFSPFLEPVKYLIAKGANPDVYDGYGNHITKNTMMEETQEYLAKLTGERIQIETSTEPEPVKLDSRNWSEMQSEMEKIFKELNQMGIIAIQETGYTQSEGFEYCSEELYKREKKQNILGFCFYTEQDSKRAKESGILPLAIWGTPDGGEPETIKVGRLVVELLAENNFEVSWNGKSSTRPEIYLHSF